MDGVSVVGEAWDEMNSSNMCASPVQAEIHWWPDDHTPGYSTIPCQIFGLQVRKASLNGEGSFEYGWHKSKAEQSVRDEYGEIVNDSYGWIRMWDFREQNP
jgi:hypothetical protein